jgi:hypothetical protein
MAKPKESELTSIQVRADKKLLEGIDRTAARKSWSRTNAAVELIRWALSASKGGRNI